MFNIFIFYITEDGFLSILITKQRVAYQQFLFIIQKEEEAANEYDYEDDFDDYEDDFESEEEEEEEVEEKENNEDSEENDLKEENSVTSEEQSSMQDGIIPQQSFLQLTQIVS